MPKRNPLEEAVLEEDNSLIIQEIVEGNRIHDPSVLASKEVFNLNIKVFYALMEIGTSAEIRAKTIEFLQTNAPEDERIELLKEAQQPLPTKPRAFEKNLFKAILESDNDAILKFLEKPSNLLEVMPPVDVLKAFLKVDQEVIRKFLYHGVGFRCLAHLLGKFVQEDDESRDLADCPCEQYGTFVNLLIGIFMHDEQDDDDDDDDEEKYLFKMEKDKKEKELADEKQREEMENLKEHVKLCVHTYLDKVKLPFQFKEEKQCFFFPVSVDGPECALYVNLLIKDFNVIYHGVLPVFCPEERRVAMAEFITRINSEIPTGNFEMNFQTGSIDIKITLPQEAIAANPQKMLGLFMLTSNSLMKKYSYALHKVLRGEMTTEMAVRNCH